MSTRPEKQNDAARLKMRRTHAAPAPFETVDQLLDAIKARENITSERKLAEAMGWSPAHLRHYRKGRSSPNDAMALQIAQRLDLHEGMVIAICHAQREQDAQLKSVWLYMARQLSKIAGAALAVGFVGVSSLGAPPARATLLTSPAIHYAQRLRRPRRRRPLRRRRRILRTVMVSTDTHPTAA